MRNVLHTLIAALALWMTLEAGTNVLAFPIEPPLRPPVKPGSKPPGKGILKPTEKTTQKLPEVKKDEKTEHHPLHGHIEPDHHKKENAAPDCKEQNREECNKSRR